MGVGKGGDRVGQGLGRLGAQEDERAVAAQGLGRGGGVGGRVGEEALDEAEVGRVSGPVRVGWGWRRGRGQHVDEGAEAGQALEEALPEARPVAGGFGQGQASVRGVGQGGGERAQVVGFAGRQGELGQGGDARARGVLGLAVPAAEHELVAHGEGQAGRAPGVDGEARSEAAWRRCEYVAGGGEAGDRVVGARRGGGA